MDQAHALLQGWMRLDTYKHQFELIHCVISQFACGKGLDGMRDISRSIATRDSYIFSRSFDLITRVLGGRVLEELSGYLPSRLLMPRPALEDFAMWVHQLTSILHQSEHLGSLSLILTLRLF